MATTDDRPRAHWRTGKIADYSGLGTGKTGHFVTVMGGKNIGEYFVLANISYFALGQQDDSQHSRGEWTCAVSRPLRGSLSAGEIYGDSRLEEMNVSFATSTWALTCGVNRKLVLDAAVIGFTSGPGTPGNAAFVGITWNSVRAPPFSGRGCSTGGVAKAIGKT